MTTIYTSFDIETGKPVCISERLPCDTKHMDGVVFEGRFDFDKFRMVDGEIVEIKEVVDTITSNDVDRHVQRIMSYPHTSYADWRVLRFLERGEKVPLSVIKARENIRSCAKKLKAMDPIPHDFADERYWK